MKIAVVVPTFGHLNYARNAVRTFREYTDDGFAVVVDDATPGWSDEDDLSFRRLCPGTLVHRFPKNGGLTRSWNHGLNLAFAAGADMVVAANSDILFTRNWAPPLIAALQRPRCLLVGPVTNASGDAPRQRVTLWYEDYNLTDDQGYLNKVASELGDKYTNRVIKGKVNGFFQAAMTSVWKRFMRPDGLIYNPINRMVGNETELHRRMCRVGHTAIVPASFIFHYRSVSRTAPHNQFNRGAFRPIPK